MSLLKNENLKTLKINKIVFIHSAHYADRGTLVQAKGFWNRLFVANVAKLGLPLLAAYTPSSIKVELIEDYFDEIPWETDAEVIAITAQVMQHKRALEIAQRFKEQKKIVVMGGFLPTQHPEEVSPFVDALCIGDGDLLWPQILKDIESEQLKKIYKANHSVSLENLPVPRYDLIKKDRMVFYPVQATRGCPFTCEYCSIIQFYNRTYRYRPIEDVIRDIKATQSKHIYFVDDNLMENVVYAKELFRRMKGLGVEWGTQVTINISKDIELLNLAYESGCRWAAIGIESITQDNLIKMSKDFNKVEKFKMAIETIQEAGIAVHALIVFGFPSDTKETFRNTVEFLRICAVAIAEFFIYTPYPATPTGQKDLEKGLIIDKNLNHYRETYVVFKHPHLTSQEIIDGYWSAFRQFYSFRNIFSRIHRGKFKNKFYHLFNNFYYWVKIARKIPPVYFGRGNFE